MLQVAQVTNQGSGQVRAREGAIRHGLQQREGVGSPGCQDAQSTLFLQSGVGRVSLQQHLGGFRLLITSQISNHIGSKSIVLHQLPKHRG